MGILKSIGAIVSCTILCLSLIFLIILMAMQQLLYPAIYIESMREGGVFRYADGEIQNLSGGNFIKIPEEGLEPLVSSLLGNLLAYVRSDTNNLNLTVEIDQDKLRNFFLEGVKNLSICGPGEFKGYDTNRPCRPAEITEEVFLDNFLRENNLTFFEGKEVNLVEVYGLEEGSEGRVALDRMRYYVSLYNLALLIVAIIALVSVTFLFLLNMKHKNKLLREIGIVLIISGTLVFMGIFSAIAQANKSMASVDVPIVSSLGMEFINILGERFYLFSGIALALGIAMITLSFFLKLKK